MSFESIWFIVSCCGLIVGVVWSRICDYDSMPEFIAWASGFYIMLSGASLIFGIEW